jgi:hypothetical protein
MGLIAVEMIRKLSDSLILPFSPETYADELYFEFMEFQNRFAIELNNWNISLFRLELAISNFTLEARRFQSKLSEIDINK